MTNFKKTYIPKVSLIISILIATIIIIINFSEQKVELLGRPAIHVLVTLQFIIGGTGIYYTKKSNIMTACLVIIIGIFNLMYLLIFY